MLRPVLKRGAEGCYLIPGYDHLTVKPCYDDPGGSRRPRIYGWVVIDDRYLYAIDRWDRWRVVFRETLPEIREWVSGGGSSRWDPDKRVGNRRYEP